MSQINFVTICLPQRLLLCLLGFNYIFTIILRVKKTQWCRYVVQGLSGLLFTTPGPGFKLKYWNIWKGNSSLDWKGPLIRFLSSDKFLPTDFHRRKTWPWRSAGHYSHISEIILLWRKLCQENSSKFNSFYLLNGNLIIDTMPPIVGLMKKYSTYQHVPFKISTTGSIFSLPFYPNRTNYRTILDSFPIFSKYFLLRSINKIANQSKFYLCSPTRNLPNLFCGLFQSSFK